MRVHQKSNNDNNNDNEVKGTFVDNSNANCLLITSSAPVIE